DGGVGERLERGRRGAATPWPEAGDRRFRLGVGKIVVLCGAHAAEATGGLTGGATRRSAPSSPGRGGQLASARSCPASRGYRNSATSRAPSSLLWAGSEKTGAVVSSRLCRASMTAPSRAASTASKVLANSPERASAAGVR